MTTTTIAEASDEQNGRSRETSHDGTNQNSTSTTKQTTSSVKRNNPGAFREVNEKEHSGTVTPDLPIRSVIKLQGVEHGEANIIPDKETKRAASMVDTETVLQQLEGGSHAGASGQAAELLTTATTSGVSDEEDVKSRETSRDGTSHDRTGETTQAASSINKSIQEPREKVTLLVTKL